VDDLAAHDRVITFDNAGIGKTSPLSPLSVSAMANQTSALITALGLARTNVLGWSMGGMIAQALAVLDPSQVRRLVLCATFPGTGATVPSATTTALTRLAPQQVETVLFPPNQANAYNAYTAAISGYPPAAAPSKAVQAAQRRAVTQWWTGKDPAGRKTAAISAPTLIADGSADWADPVANEHAFARLIPAARLILYPDAAHAFLFQDPTQFAAVVESFLKA
jgi:pimeloyl-ACP methyl ester carboxylesterase